MCWSQFVSPVWTMDIFFSFGVTFTSRGKHITVDHIVSGFWFQYCQSPLVYVLTLSICIHYKQPHCRHRIDMTQKMLKIYKKILIKQTNFKYKTTIIESWFLEATLWVLHVSVLFVNNDLWPLGYRSRLENAIFLNFDQFKNSIFLLRIVLLLVEHVNCLNYNICWKQCFLHFIEFIFISEIKMIVRDHFFSELFI